MPETKPSFSLDDLLKQHLAATGMPKKGEVRLVEILHDDECGVFLGGACDCAPDIASGPMIDAKYGLGDGE